MKAIYILPIAGIVITTAVITAFSKSPDEDHVNIIIQDEVPDLPTVEEAQNILYSSADGGVTWNNFSSGLPQNVGVSSAFAKDGVFFLGTQNGYLYHSLNPESGSWVTEGIGGVTTYEQITGIFPGNSGTYVCIYGVGLFRKSSVTNEWEHLSQNLKGPFVNDVVENQQGTLFVSGPEGIYKSENDGQTWKHVFTTGWTSSLVLKNNVLLGSGQGGILRSVDQGETWNYILEDEGAVYDFRIMDDRMLAIRMAGSWRTSDNNTPQNMYTSADGGATWEHQYGPSPEQPIYEFEQVGELLFYCNQAGISRSADGGQTWQLVHPSAKTDRMERFELIISGDRIFAVVRPAGC